MPSIHCPILWKIMPNKKILNSNIIYKCRPVVNTKYCSVHKC